MIIDLPWLSDQVDLQTGYITTAQIATGEGGVAGEYYRLASTGKAEKAQADTFANCVRPLGFLLYDAVEGDLGFFKKSGKVDIETWGLTLGSEYYLSAVTPGAISVTAPVSGVTVSVGTAFYDYRMYAEVDIQGGSSFTASSIYVDNVYELTGNHGVIIDSVTLKDGDVILGATGDAVGLGLTATRHVYNTASLQEYVANALIGTWSATGLALNSLLVSGSTGYAGATGLYAGIAAGTRHVYNTASLQEYVGAALIGTWSATGLNVAGTTPTLRLDDTRTMTWAGGETLGTIEFFTNDDSSGGNFVMSSIRQTNVRASSLLPGGSLVFATTPNGGSLTDRFEIDKDGVIKVYGNLLFSGIAPNMQWYESDADADEKWYEWLASGGKMIWRTVQDSLVNNYEFLGIDRTGTTVTAWVWNENGWDTDFRWESDTRINAFFIQGSDGFVGINTGTPGKDLDVVGDIRASGIGYFNHIAEATGAHTVTLDNSVTLANSAIFNIQEYLNFTGATGENAIRMPDNLADAFSIQEGTNKYLTFDTTNTAESILSVNFYPMADNTYYLGKNDDDSPLSWKGIIVKDQADGKYYRIECINGIVTATDLTD